MDESAYKRFTWGVVAALGTIGLAAGGVILQQVRQVDQLQTTMVELRKAIETMQSDLRSMATHGETLQREAARNAEQERHITELRIWQAKVESKMPTK